MKKDDFDIEKFNNDPAFEVERTQFDQMFEGSFKRFMAKNKPVEDEDESIFDRIFGSKRKES